MSKGKNKLGANKKGSYKAQSNPARVAAMQALRASGASGAHNNARTRAELEREAIEEEWDNE